MSSPKSSMPWLERWAFGRVKSWANKETERLKKTRQQIPDFSDKVEPIVRMRTYKADELLTMSKNHWLLRTILRIRIEEIMNAGGEVTPRFEKRCKNCGKEYQTKDVEECDVSDCKSKDFDYPDIDQYKRLTELVKEPSPDKDWDTFVRSTLHYGLALDEFHWEIAQLKTYDPMTRKYSQKPGLEIRVLDTSTVSPIVDPYGNLGNHEYFCPLCYEQRLKDEGRDPVIDIREFTDRGIAIPPCKVCGGELKPTHYVQKLHGNVVARWTKDEIVRDTPNSIDPEWFGLSRVVSGIKHLFIIDFMDSYNLQVYSQGDIGSLVVFPDTDDEEVQELKQKLDNQLKKRVYRDVITGENSPTLQILTAMIGVQSGKEPKRLALMESLSNLQSIDYYSLYVEKVCGLFGVIPTFTQSQRQTGDGGRTLAITYMVPNSTTRSTMKNFEDAFNNKLIPILGITDWVWNFGKLESKDQLREAQIKHQNIMAASLALTAGFEIEMQPDAMSYTMSTRSTGPLLPNSRETAGKVPQDKDGPPRRTMPGGSAAGIPVSEPESEA